MKTIKSLFSLLFISSLILGGCSTDDTHCIIDDTVVLPCDDSPQKLLTLHASFQSGANSMGVNSYEINNLDSSQPHFLGHSPATNLLHELPTNGSIYSPQDNLHGLAVTRPGQYFTFNTDTGIAQTFNIPTDISAPVMLNNSTYIIEVSNSGYANDSIGDHYEIKSFDIHTGTTGAALAIDPMTKEFDNNSFFHVQSMSSTTNGIDELYFLSGTNLITVNISNNTASHIDLYPTFSHVDYVRFYGLEYSESLGLIALMDIPDDLTQHLIQIDTTASGNHNILITVPEMINSEFYSTAYRECDQTYYLASLASNSIETKYYEFDLATNSQINSQSFLGYLFGIELLP